MFVGIPVGFDLIWILSASIWSVNLSTFTCLSAKPIWLYLFCRLIYFIRSVTRSGFTCSVTFTWSVFVCSAPLSTLTGSVTLSTLTWSVNLSALVCWSVLLSVFNYWLQRSELKGWWVLGTALVRCYSFTAFIHTLVPAVSILLFSESRFVSVHAKTRSL